MAEGFRVLPEITKDNESFWTGGKDGALHILRCTNCGYYVHPPAPVCPQCHSREVRPTLVSGKGTVFSFTINYQAFNPRVPPPYVIALVELPEQAGLRLTTDIINCDVDAVHIGMPVKVVFEEREEVFVPLFEPDTSGTSN